MKLEEQVVVDKIEILESGLIQVREADRILDTDAGVIKAESYHRYIIRPGQSAPSDAPDVLNRVIAAVHTPDLIQAFESEQEADKKRREDKRAARLAAAGGRN